jgi:hypothetical protein
MDMEKSQETTKRTFVEGSLPSSLKIEEKKDIAIHQMPVEEGEGEDKGEEGIYYAEHEQDIEDRTNDIYKSEAINKERVTTRTSTRPSSDPNPK